VSEAVLRYHEVNEAALSDESLREVRRLRGLSLLQDIQTIGSFAASFIFFEFC
jgi:hypothetical protein